MWSVIELNECLYPERVHQNFAEWQKVCMHVVKKKHRQRPDIHRPTSFALHSFRPA